MNTQIFPGDIVKAAVSRQIPLDFVIPSELHSGSPALYLGETADSEYAYVLYFGAILVIAKHKLVKCTTQFPQA